ncbi:hypothetical protein HNV11_11850 [Spirosoma taeanense]|uniref:Mannitol dehydrogenase C-terminal domain-containing protein n=1 Tax=Spirosoma taeanense TaxID=2735870 RepID=A0A6M5Y7Z0_9BACT|nr:hypothetical protein [Spirosoma taeanense]QJW90019.1 hypothetical protein HNV11_11850 [Spirosoma taeanense]
MLTTIQNQSTTDLLNASQCMLSYPAYLAGYRTVQEAMQDRLFNAYLNAFLNATQDCPDSRRLSGLSGGGNESLLAQLTDTTSDTELEELCRDGASRLSAFILPILLDRLKRGREISCLAFLLAAYGHYLHTGMDDKGEIYTVDEPHLTDEDWLRVNDLDTTAFLAMSPFAAANLLDFPQLVAPYKIYRIQIACYGLVFSLKQALCAFWETQPEVSESSSCS